MQRHGFYDSGVLRCSLADAEQAAAGSATRRPQRHGMPPRPRSCCSLQSALIDHGCWRAV